MKGFTGQLTKFLSFLTLAFVLTAPFLISVEVDAKMPSIIENSMDPEEIVDDTFSEAFSISLFFIIGGAVISVIWIGHLYLQGEYETAVQRLKQSVMGLMVVAIAPYIGKFFATLMGVG